MYSLSHSRSQKALYVFGLLATAFLVWQALDWSPRPYFLVVDGSDGTVELQREIALRPNLKVKQNGVIHTQFAPATLVYQDTTVQMDERTILTIKSIRDDHLRFFSSRGHWNIVPDRDITTCTRAVCINTASEVEVFYYTPGEVVDVRVTGDATVTFGDETFFLEAEDRIVIDELTREVRQN